MLYAVIALFALAVLLGLTILIRWLSQKDSPKGVVYIHGLVAAAALVMLLLYTLNNPGSMLRTSLTLFVIGAVGGFYLFYKDQFRNTKPVFVAFIHALLGIAGLITLLVFVFG